jgi:hypothetical protein
MPVTLTAPLAPGCSAPSRRGFIAGCAGLATAIGLTAEGARSTETRHLAGDLFAFTAPDRPEVVFAVTLPPQPFGQTERELGQRAIFPPPGSTALSAASDLHPLQSDRACQPWREI